MYMVRRLIRRRRQIARAYGPHAYHPMRQWRAHLSLSQIELARRMGVKYPTIGRYETGRMAMTLDAIDMACSAMNITRVQFFAGPPDEK
jgi:transcriptional regulator with XRE-family HTH domain